MNPQQLPSPVANAADPAAAPQPRKARAVRTVEDIFGDLRAEGKRWMRASAGYNVIGAALASLNGTLQSGERKRAIPLLMTQPTRFCEEDVELVFDLNKLPAGEAEFMLIPLTNAQVPVINESLDAMYNLIVELRQAQGLPPTPSPKVAAPGGDPAAAPAQPPNG